MCGIVGAVAQRNIVPILIEGLRRLEYRGYDSCGVAVLADGGPRRARSVARVADLDAQVRERHLEGITGIAHTRWATHGAPVTDNAHPIFSKDTWRWYITASSRTTNRCAKCCGVRATSSSRRPIPKLSRT